MSILEKPPSARKYAQDIINERSYTLQLIRGYDICKRPFFAFCLFNAKKFEEVKARINNEEWVDLENDCVIVYKKIGTHIVSDEIKKYALYIFHRDYLKKQ